MLDIHVGRHEFSDTVHGSRAGCNSKVVPVSRMALLLTCQQAPVCTSTCRVAFGRYETRVFPLKDYSVATV